MSVENIRTIIRLTFQNASLKQRIRKLEAELAELKAGLWFAENSDQYVGDASIEIARLRAEIEAQAQEIAELKANPPAGYEHYTPETIAAIRSTCSTQASRVGQTQDEVFAESDPPPAKEDSQ